ncbi:GAF and ANTAR domain-containing protein [Stackebrandtia nassauensis]|uniref:GAF and ANTAR domain-containing protein n=1 Tax=Stackebrandtia nassauensis TaxID=283811 RepID=UPI0001A3ADC6|nr:GAF and ANTAR domain-containing protein [Stackebrandtia nassauensis]
MSEVCLELLPGLDGASITVIGNPAAHATVSTAGDDVGMTDLQFTLGEGPYVDAHNDRRPVLASDLSEPGYRVRWPAFTPASLAAGVHAVFALPLRIGAIHVGVLNLHRREPGELGVIELSDAFAFAEAVTLLVLGHSASGEDQAPQLRVQHRVALHQATGIIMAQLGVSVEEAFVRLRAYTYVDGRTLDEVAVDVVARRIRFDVEEQT